MTLSPTSSRGAGGTYTPPVTRQELFGPTSTTIAGSARAHVPFTSSSGPDVLVDRTDPLIPTIITAGVYYVQVSARSVVPNPFLLEVQLDSGGFDASAYATAYATGAAVTGQACAGFAWYLPAGANVEAWITNQHPTDDNDYGIHAAHIQRLS